MLTVSSRSLRISMIAAAASAALFLAGCSGDSTESSSNTTTSMPGMAHGSSTTVDATTTGAAQRTDYNEADVTFLQMMYSHHAQAIEMAKLVPTRSDNPKIQELAANIERAQSPEMAQITALLTSFGKPTPTMSMDSSSGMGGGMMSAEQMQALEAASGAEFDRMFLTMMIEHHTSAVEMANTELAAGNNADAKSLAEKIVAAQQTEIEQMKATLAEN